MQARRVVFSAPGRVALETFELPAPAHDEVIVETKASVISPGTERAFLLAEPNTATRQLGFPYYPGYSNVGRVVGIGKAVSNVQIGDLLGTMCAHQSHVLVRPPLDHPRQHGHGALFDSVEPSGLAWRLPGRHPSLPPAALATFIIAAVALYGVTRAQIKPGDQVIVAGLGPIGLLAGQFARLSGGLPIVGISATDARRKHAVSLGFDEVYASIDAFRQQRANYSYAAKTVVIEATGRPDNVLTALTCCPTGATLLLLGSSRGSVNEVDFYTLLHRKAITVIGAHQPTRPAANPLENRWAQYWDADTALRMIASGRLDVAPVINREFAVERIEEAYRFVFNAPDALCVSLSWS